MTANDVEAHEPDESFNQQQTREYRHFDVDATIDTAEQPGEVIIRLGLTEVEAEALWQQLQGDGHTYPEDVRERVLSAMEYNMQGTTCKVQRAGRGD